MKIAVDAMGGDYAPEEIVKGAVMAAKDYGVDIILVGPNERIEKELANYEKPGSKLEIVATNEYSRRRTPGLCPSPEPPESVPGLEYDPLRPIRRRHGESRCL